MQVFDTQGQLVTENIKGNKPEEGASELKLEPSEVIVSASVDVDRLYPVSFKFIVFDSVKVTTSMLKKSAEVKK